MSDTTQRDVLALLHTIFAPAVDGFIVIDPTGTVKMVNQAVQEIFGYTSEEVVGRNVRLLMPYRYAEEHDGYLKNYIDTGRTKVIGIGREVEAKSKDGVEFPIDLSVSEIVIEGERHFVGIVRDITERREAERLIEAQHRTLMELSTPAIQLWDDIVLMPLVGEIDSERAANLIVKLLECIADSEAEVAILDLTGVPVIDTDVARHLMKTVSAARMLGAQVILTGIKPSGAQTLVQLGIDLGEFNTKGSLRSGVSEAMRLTARRVVPESGDRPQA